MFVGRAVGRAQSLLLIAFVLVAVPSVGRSQSMQNLFGFGRSDVGATPETAVAPQPAETDAAAAVPEGKPDGKRQRRSRPSAHSGETRRVRQSAGDASKDGQYGSFGERINANTVTIVTGERDETYAAVADDLAAVLGGDDMRILPILGKGGAQNIRDVRFMKGVDLGITQTNLLAHFKRTNEIGPIDNAIVYVAKLFNEEMHVVVRTGDVATLADLAGRRVNFGEVGSGTQLTARDVFGRLGIKPVEVNLDQAQALSELEAGHLSATVQVSGKPAAAVAKLAGRKGLRLLSIPYPEGLHDDYLPAALTAADYPGLVDEPVDTVAVGAVLIAYDWPKGSDRYRRLEKFVAAFFARLADLQASTRHAKWRETNLAAVLPGWHRFAGAEEWLRKHRDKVVGWPDYKGFFAAGAASDGAGARSPDSERLFQEYLKWNRDSRN
jgi:uncharacterized protein